ncbi:hypothetical protein JCM8208_006472 [Rhodotorula glutinis]
MDSQPPLAFQHLQHQHQPHQPQQQHGGYSPTNPSPFVSGPVAGGPAASPGAEGVYAGHGGHTYPPPMHHDTAMSPSSAASFATPALSHDGSVVSLSSSADSPATLPLQFTPGSSPAYLHQAASPAQGDYFNGGGGGVGGSPGLVGGAGGPTVGLGFGALAAAEGKGKERQGPSPGASAVPGAAERAARASPAERELPRRQTTRPAEFRHRGEELGLTLGDFDMLDTLGTGTFGRVLLARLRTSPNRPNQTQPHYFAMKVLEKNTVVRLRQVEHVNSERSTLAHVRHPFVVNLFCTFQDEANLYMLLEYVQGGELFSHLRRAQRFSADVARFYTANIILVLENLHAQDIIYRDLKPENLLIDSTGHIKVTDFGFAKYVPERTWTLCGTPEYLAPEIITATGHGAAADWWALGVLLFELLAGYPPFFADNPLEIYEKILAGRYGVPRHIDPLAKDLIGRLLTDDLTKRLGNLKGGAQDVKNHPWFEGVDWESLARKEIRAPIIPLTTNPGDVSNYERYPATAIETLPGVLRAISQRKYGFSPEKGPDPYGYLFPLF